jgi:hypothetical protein
VGFVWGCGDEESESGEGEEEAVMVFVALHVRFLSLVSGGRGVDDYKLQILSTCCKRRANSRHEECTE